MYNHHQQNIYEIFQSMAKVPGWEILEQDGILAFKAPVPEPLVNFVWGEANPASLAKARDFFGDSPFTWVLDAGQGDEPLAAAGFLPPEAIPDQTLELEGYGFPGYPPGISIIRAYSSQDLRFWLATAGEALGLDSAVARAFYPPLVREAGCVPFLALFEGVPAATSLAYCGAGATGIYAVGTREGYRGKGLGQAVTHACLRLAQNQGARRAVLSASAMGSALYRKLGFRTERALRYYTCRPH